MSTRTDEDGETTADAGGSERPPLNPGKSEDPDRQAREEEGLPEPRWPDEVAKERAHFYGIRTAALVANEHRWVHRRVERFEMIDEVRARRHMSVDFTLPDLPDAPWDEGGRTWLVPIGLLRKDLLRGLDVRDEHGAALPILTREQNSNIAWALLRFLAEATLEDTFGPDQPVEETILEDLADVAGARRAPEDFVPDHRRAVRPGDAIRRFREAAIRAAASVDDTLEDPVDNQRQVLWRDGVMRGFMTTLASRFLLLAVLDAPPGSRRIVKVTYEQEFELPPVEAQESWLRRVRALMSPLSPASLRIRLHRVIPYELKSSKQAAAGSGSTKSTTVWLRFLSGGWPYLQLKQLRPLDPTETLSGQWEIFRHQAVQSWANLRQRARKSLALDAYEIKAGTRAVFGPESYHVELPAPEELVIEEAFLKKIRTVTDLSTGAIESESSQVARDELTERAHLYESLYSDELRRLPPEANQEVATSATITALLFIRPSFIRPALVIGVLTTTMLAAGLIADAAGTSRDGDVTALIVVLPALFAAYLIPGEHRLVRLMFRWLRGLVFALAVVSFAAAASLTLSLSQTTLVACWLLLLGVSGVATGLIGWALYASSRRMARRPESAVHSGHVS